MSGDVVLTFNRLRLMGVIASELRRIEEPASTGNGTVLRCEFELESRRYKEKASRVTIVTCVAEGKQAKEILDNKKAGDALLVSGTVGSFDRFGPGRSGTHKLRITRVHFSHFNDLEWGGVISSEPFLDERSGTVSFYLSGDERIKVLAREGAALFIKQIGPASSVGTPVVVHGEIEEIRGEHVLVSGLVRPLKPKEWLDPIKAALDAERRKKTEEKHASKANPSGRPSGPEPGPTQGSEPTQVPPAGV